MIKRTYRFSIDTTSGYYQLINKQMNQDYDPYERKLANEIADTLKDRDSITMHLQYVRKYKEEFLRKVLNKVMALPESKIRKSRAALYTFLINQGSSNADSGH